MVVLWPNNLKMPNIFPFLLGHCWVNPFCLNEGPETVKVICQSLFRYMGILISRPPSYYHIQGFFWPRVNSTAVATYVTCLVISITLLINEQYHFPSFQRLSSRFCHQFHPSLTSWSWHFLAVDPKSFHLKTSSFRYCLFYNWHIFNIHIRHISSSRQWLLIENV